MSAHPLARTAAVILAAAVLAACASATDNETTQTTDSGTAQASPSPSPAVPDAAIAVASVVDGAITLAPPIAPSSARVESAPDSDTGVVASITLTEPTVLWIAFDVGATIDIASDGTAAVLTPDGALAVGLTAPDLGTVPSPHSHAAWSAVPDAARPTLALAVPDDASYPVAATVHLGTSVVAATMWGTNEGGESLAVTPSDWGRVSGQVGATYGWADVVRREPAAGTNVMEKQFDCHFLGAKDKVTWNLEPWRPDVSFMAYALARCNPT